eukprot:CAMPEP_0172792550 /NCGR_PEP_ID=MMETSP1074-20121228/209029_1 /TAXON_ID=2916 /ORGANISM="Ceratium fusus, Strain PA161109" /LENGTH=238 /DNA_ID=CAMNT_0013629617 /DNA_START=273 /DNA_END=991 /DNA_ORIENTATION=-
MEASLSDVGNCAQSSGDVILEGRSLRCSASSALLPLWVSSPDVKVMPEQQRSVLSSTPINHSSLDAPRNHCCCCCCCLERVMPSSEAYPAKMEELLLLLLLLVERVMPSSEAYPAKMEEVVSLQGTSIPVPVGTAFPRRSQLHLDNSIASSADNTSPARDLRYNILERLASSPQSSKTVSFFAFAFSNAFFRTSPAAVYVLVLVVPALVDVALVRRSEPPTYESKAPSIEEFFCRRQP